LASPFDADEHINLNLSKVLTEQAFVFIVSEDYVYPRTWGQLLSTNNSFLQSFLAEMLGKQLSKMNSTYTQAIDYLKPITSPECFNLYMTFIDGIAPTWNGVIMQKKYSIICGALDSVSVTP
jgi:hypothetical protein